MEVFQQFDVDNMFDCVGNGFGQRTHCCSLGINAYFGDCKSKRVLPSPDLGDSNELYLADYYRSYYAYPEKKVSVINKLRCAVTLARNTMKEIADNYMVFIGNETCN